MTQHHDQQRPLHRLRQARTRQGLSSRCVGKRLQRPEADILHQEQEHTDLLLSQLYEWQAALGVPLDELLVEPDDTLSPRILNRARMLRIMKTVQALQEKLLTQQQKHLGESLISQLIHLMPELKTVSAWPSVGQRRTSDEMGKIVENPVSERWFHESN